MTRQHREPATQAAAAEEEEQTVEDKVQLGRGPLLGCSPAVQVDVEGMDEGDQTQHRQADVHLKRESGENVSDLSHPAGAQFWTVVRVLT